MARKNNPYQSVSSYTCSLHFSILHSYFAFSELTTAASSNDVPVDHLSINEQESEELLGSPSPQPEPRPKHEVIEINSEQESEKAMSM